METNYIKPLFPATTDPPKDLSLGRFLLVRVTNFLGRDLRIPYWGVGLLPLSLRDGRQDMVSVVRRHSLT